MNTSSVATAKKWAVEFTIIVTGVFVAVAAESWWSDREQRQYEREIREDMIVEFEENIRILNADIASNDAVSARLSALIGDSERTLLALENDALLGELDFISDWAGFDPEMGSAQAFVESGNVASITDRQLRRLMARWAGLLEMRRRFNLQAVDFGLQVLTPVFASASADKQWSPAERREVYVLLVHKDYLLRTVLKNQRELRDSARKTLVYLQESR